MFRLYALCLSLFATITVADDTPISLDPNWTVELIDSEPDLVTPTGCCYDDQNRLMVIECHTHFPPDDYAGPKVDRIYRFDDSSGDGVVDRKRLYYQGGVASMNIANLGDGSFAIATRSELVRIRDLDNDGTAETKEVLLSHKTKATYPHNGLGGLTLGHDGWLYVGQGENFGEPYVITGTDGSTQVGGGEGGNVYRCRPDGSQLQRVATGFWNPFGIMMDTSDRLFVVGNDPDAMPPNRLTHVVTAGDFGFQFRFGRAGIHPLQCWNGELPGTLPMVAGTGEAICGVAAVGSDLWTTSWGDNRIERYALQPNGASWTSKTEVVIQGGANFRPVGIAVASDGSVFVTDWVDRSYSVHGKGRLWRISSKSNQLVGGTLPVKTPAEQSADSLSSSSELTQNERLNALEINDPYIRQAAIAGLVTTGQLDAIDFGSITNPKQIVGLLTAWRWKELSDPTGVSASQRTAILNVCLKSSSDDVVFAAIRWATERQQKDQLSNIEALLNKNDLSLRNFSAVIASIAYLQTGSASGAKRDPAIEKTLVDFAMDSERSARLRALAIRRLPAESEVPSDVDLLKIATENQATVVPREIVCLLTARSTGSAQEQLKKILRDGSFDSQTRADALAGLSLSHSIDDTMLQQFSKQNEEVILAAEANRILDTVNADTKTRPDINDLDAWETFIGEGGNADAGARVFLRRNCSSCHQHFGRGANTGPNLTTLAGSMTRRRILESILQPSKEIGPLYVPWMVLTTDGTIRTGLKLDAAGVGNAVRFQGADGKIFEIALKDIDQQKPIATSIMPAGLESTMSFEELRDLLAYLTQVSTIFTEHTLLQDSLGH